MNRVAFKEVSEKISEPAKRIGEIIMDSKSSGEADLALIELATRYHKKHGDPMPEWAFNELVEHRLVDAGYGK